MTETNTLTERVTDRNDMYPKSSPSNLIERVGRGSDIESEEGLRTYLFDPHLILFIPLLEKHITASDLQTLHLKMLNARTHELYS